MYGELTRLQKLRLKDPSKAIYLYIYGKLAERESRETYC